MSFKIKKIKTSDLMIITNELKSFLDKQSQPRIGKADGNDFEDLLKIEFCRKIIRKIRNKVEMTLRQEVNIEFTLSETVVIFQIVNDSPINANAYVENVFRIFTNSLYEYLISVNKNQIL